METKFRLGGYLVNKRNADKYIVLSNGRVKWSVQVPSTIFYMSTKQMEEETTHVTDKDKNKYEKQIEELKLIIADQELKIKKLKEKNKDLKTKKNK
jgi:ABC-type molybdate transport system ATPase subunit